MNNQLQIFDNQEFGQIRVMKIDEKEFFGATDVARALGYSNPQKAIRDHCKEKGVTICSVPTEGGTQSVKFIDEGNLYRLIVKSKLPGAQKFEEWIFDEVLPTIRKTGGYVADEEMFINTYFPKLDHTAKNFMIQQLKQTKELVKENEIMKPKAEMYDVLLSGDNNQTIGEVAKAFGIGRNKLFAILREKKILISKGAMKNTPYQRYIDNDYFEVREISTTRGDKTINVVQTMVTPKGIDYIGKLLKKEGLIQLSADLIAV